MTDRRARLLYVEDDAVIGDLTRDVLGEDYEVSWVRDLESARAETERTRFEAIVLDRRLPGGDGVELVRDLRRRGSRTPVLLLTAIDAVAERVDGLDAGADDYLVKPFDFDELLARVRVLLRGSDERATRREIGDWILVPATQAMYGPGGERAALTAAESRLMETLAAEPERVFSREELQAAVFENSESVSIVDTYVHYVRRKTAPEVIVTVRARGYRVGG